MMNNILTHEEGLERFYQLKNRYEHEIELDCLNNSFIDIEELNVKLKAYQTVLSLYPENSIIKESEFHEKKIPFYEASVFCNSIDVKKIVEQLIASGLSVDIIHDN